eukprot:COSAG02_NODE_2695_length_8214_cov_12.071842_7_plen_64_part_00
MEPASHSLWNDSRHPERRGFNGDLNDCLLRLTLGRGYCRNMSGAGSASAGSRRFIKGVKVELQ